MVHNGVLLMRALAVFLLQNTVLVAHEASRVGVHGYTHWSQSDELLESFVGDVVFLLLAFVEEFLFTLNALALSFSCLILVRVVFLFNDTLGPCELICIKHPSTSATEVTFITIDQILHRVLMGLRFVFNGV
jgi:hypothetical protein